MEIRRLDSKDEYWYHTIKLAEKCSWSAGPNLARRMRENEFTDFECPFIAVDDGTVAGFCTITKTDYIPNCNYSPWIGFVFVDENYRGNRISQKMIEKVLSYAKSIRFKRVYISTGEENLYEKYGFVPIDTLKNYAGTLESILVYEL